MSAFKVNPVNPVYISIVVGNTLTPEKSRRVIWHLFSNSRDPVINSLLPQRTI